MARPSTGRYVELSGDACAWVPTRERTACPGGRGRANILARIDKLFVRAAPQGSGAIVERVVLVVCGKVGCVGVAQDTSVGDCATGGRDQVEALVGTKRRRTVFPQGTQSRLTDEGGKIGN